MLDENKAILKLIFALLLFAGRLHGQSETELAVSFPKGAHSIIIRGVVGFVGYQHYAVYARKGQIIRARLSSDQINVSIGISRPNYDLENLEFGTESILRASKTGKYIVHLSVAAVLGRPTSEKKISDNKNYELEIGLENPDITIESVYSGSTLYLNKYLGFEMAIPGDWKIDLSQNLQQLIERIQFNNQVLLPQKELAPLSTIFSAERRNASLNRQEPSSFLIMVEEEPQNISLQKHFELVKKRGLSRDSWKLTQQIPSMRIGGREFYKLTYVDSDDTITYFVTVSGRKSSYFTLICSLRDEETIEDIMDGITFFNQHGKVQTGREIKVNRKKFVEEPFPPLQIP